MLWQSETRTQLQSILSKNLRVEHDVPKYPELHTHVPLEHVPWTQLGVHAAKERMGCEEAPNGNHFHNINALSTSDLFTLIIDVSAQWGADSKGVHQTNELRHSKFL